MDCKHCNAQLLPDCECLTCSNRYNSALFRKSPKAAGRQRVNTLFSFPLGFQQCIKAYHDDGLTFKLYELIVCNEMFCFRLYCSCVQTMGQEQETALFHVVYHCENVENCFLKACSHLKIP